MAAKGNTYARALGTVLHAAPKQVVAAVAVSILSGGGDRLDEARNAFLREWQCLHDNGIVPQAPPKKLMRAVPPDPDDDGMPAHQPGNRDCPCDGCGEARDEREAERRMDAERERSAERDDGPEPPTDDAYEDASPGKPRVGGSNEDDAGRFYCEPCGVRSDEPHDHTDDTVEPLIRPRGDY